ncbi:MAG: flagellar motor switch protein FliN [Candidatus Acidiferrales bacterium]
MSTGALPEISVSDQEFAQIWADATSRVLESLHGKPFMATPRPPGAAGTAVAASGESSWMRFQASGSVAGEFAFQFTRSDGVRLARSLAGEPLDGSAAFNETHTDALQETFRQFAGVAATACKSKYGGEPQFQSQRGSEPDWTPAGYAAWIFEAPEIAPLQWTLLLNADLRDSLASFRDNQQANAAPEAAIPPAQPLATAGSPEPPPTPEYTPSSGLEQPVIDAPPDATAGGEYSAPMPANLDLLLDVELDASLRFGQRDMLLREILELRPGSVVELDRKVQEPAELLVSGRVIARGEVVIVDGNYGLRITDIVQPQQRIESLET